MTRMEELYQETQDQEEPGQGDYCEGCGITGVELVYGNQWCQDCLDKAVEHADILYEAPE